jgi:hypothetical protein
VEEVDRESRQRQASAVAGNMQTRREEVCVRTVETEEAVIYHMMGMVDTDLEEYRHVDIAPGPEGRSCCTGSYNHCRPAPQADIAGAGDYKSAACPYLAACPAQPADDVHSSLPAWMFSTRR